ncbi:MAG: hypothetical protein WDN45_05640, partial [Caulobacteraceae bacterium]
MGALGVLVAFMAQDWRQRAALLARFAAGALGAATAVWALWSVVSGRAAHFEALTLYSRIYASAGFMLLRTAQPPAAWTLAIAVAVIGITSATIARFRSTLTERQAILGYLSVLGVGLMTYYFADRPRPICWPA